MYLAKYLASPDSHPKVSLKDFTQGRRGRGRLLNVVLLLPIINYGIIIVLLVRHSISVNMTVLIHSSLKNLDPLIIGHPLGKTGK